MKRFFPFIALAAVTVLSVFSCQQEPGGIRVSSISLSKSTLELTVGDQASLDATISPDNATNKKISWSSSKKSVATVTPDGIVDAVSAGTAFITATSEDSGVSAKCEITVKENVIIVTGEATHISCRNARFSGKVTLSQTTATNLSFGVLYSTSSDGFFSSATQLEATESDAENCFTVDSGVLEPETTYYYRSYAILNDEVSYGQIESFKTLALSSMIQTLDASDVYPKEATLNAMLDLTDCKYSSIEYGFELTLDGGQAKTITANNLADKAFSYRDETLSINTGYSYAAFVKLDDILYKGETKPFTTTAPPEPSLVDLGLSVKWASCNLGASKPTECGGYYQWAGTKDVSDTSIYLDHGNCPYYTGSDNVSGWTKYNTQSAYGTVDNKTVLEAKDDAAAVTLGGKWRIPTDEEWTELINTDNCSWTWKTIDGVNGYKVQSKKPGYTDNWIFLPAAGNRCYEYLITVGSHGGYWSSSLHTDYTRCAYGMSFDPIHVGRSYNNRYYGQSVRPVSE
ncbi:MAG: Ig-like domain-containing protein [Bacteroidales bacterium]|nr:Ig-like domain-containing protein [Bacteroidales bacterium]